MNKAVIKAEPNAALKNFVDKTNKSPDDFLSPLTEGLSGEELLSAAIQSDIAAEISTAHIAKGLSQREPANALGVSQALVSRSENGDVNFTLQTRVRISPKAGYQDEISLYTIQESVHITDKPKVKPQEVDSSYMVSSDRPIKHSRRLGQAHS